jgi:hypothetical protein
VAGVNTSRRSCLFYGGVTGVILLVLVLAAIFLGLHTAKKLFNQFTDTKPMPMPTVSMTPVQIAAVQQRFESFRDDVRAHKSTQPLTLSAEDLDALLQSEPDFAAMKGKLYVTGIQSNSVEAKISLPMDEIGLPAFKGRYLNATASLSISLRNGVLRIVPQSVSAKNRPLQPVYMEQVKKQNLAKDINRDPRASVALDRLQSIEIQNNQVVVVPKQE